MAENKKTKILPDTAQEDPKTSIEWTPETIKFYFDKALGVLNQDNFATSKEYIDLLVNQCLAEKHWEEGFNYFLQQVKAQGLEIETAQDQFKKLQEKLFGWRAARMLIHASGLGFYEEEIMSYEIAKHYQPIVMPPTLPPVKGPSYARPPRRPTEPKKDSIFRPKPSPPRPPTAPKPKPESTSKGKKS